MVELMTDLPDHVAAYKASEAISKEEYESIVMARVNEVAERYGKIDFLVLLETSMANYSIAAFIDYLKISFKHFTRWNRMAIVSDEAWVRKVYDILGHVVHGEIRVYEISELQKAKNWVSGIET